MYSSRFLFSIGMIFVGFGWTAKNVANLWLNGDFDAAAARILIFAGVCMISIGLSAGLSRKTVAILSGIGLLLINVMGVPVVYSALNEQFDAPACLLLTIISNLALVSIPLIKALSENLTSRNQAIYVPELNKEDKYQNLLK